MINTGDEKPSPVPREARKRGNGCLNEANDFTMKECGVYDTMGDNMAQSVHINGNGNIIVLTGNQPTPGTSQPCVDSEQGGGARSV